MKLVIVESPTKAKTISQYLGDEFVVRSSYGHVRDLPKSDLGIDTEHDFKPTYIVPTKAKKNLSELKKEAAKADEIIKRGESIVTLRGLQAKGEVRRGRMAGEEIIRAAKDWEADLIVMGTRTEIRMAQEILGRTSDLILRRAPCEVIVDRLSAEA